MKTKITIEDASKQQFKKLSMRSFFKCSDGEICMKIVHTETDSVYNPNNQKYNAIILNDQSSAERYIKPDELVECIVTEIIIKI